MPSESRTVNWPLLIKVADRLVVACFFLKLFKHFSLPWCFVFTPWWMLGLLWVLAAVEEVLRRADEGR